jgi:hypothetical protein
VPAAMRGRSRGAGAAAQLPRRAGAAGGGDVVAEPDWQVDDLAARWCGAPPATATLTRRACWRSGARHAVGPLPVRRAPSCARAWCGIACRHAVGAQGRAAAGGANGGTIPDRGLYPVHLGPAARASASSTRRWSTRAAGRPSCSAPDVAHRRHHPRPVIVTPAPGEPGDAVLARRGPGRPHRARPRARAPSSASSPGAAGASARGGRSAAAPRWIEPAAARNLVSYVAEQDARPPARSRPTAHRHRALPRRARRLAGVHPVTLRPAGAHPVGLLIERRLEAALGYPVQL